MTARAYVALIRILTRIDLDASIGTFSAIRRNVVNAAIAMRELDQNYRLVLLWLGFDWSYVDYERSTRQYGATSYSLRQRIALAAKGLAFFGQFALRALVWIGFGVASLAVLGVLALVIQWAVLSPPPGWASVMVTLLLIGGVITFALGIVGLYVGRVYEQVADRPPFVIRDDSGPPDS